MIRPPHREGRCRRRLLQVEEGVVASPYRSIPAEGQFDKTSCWAASLCWWLKAAKDGRPQWSQSKIISEYNKHCDPDTGVFVVKDIMDVFGKDSRLKMSLGVFEVSKYKHHRALPLGDAPVFILFRHKEGFTHANVVFEPNDQARTVACMEPLFPRPGKDGQRTGKIETRKCDEYYADTHVVLGWPTVKFS